MESAWRLSAGCHDSSPDLFHPRRPSDSQESAAKAVCSSCPVSSQCLEFALTFESVVGEGRYGIFGGLTPAERAALGRRDRQPKPILHGTIAGFSAHRRRGESLCGPCHDSERVYKQGRRTG